MTLQQAVLMFGIFGLLALTLRAAQPSWWNSSGAVNSSGATNDYEIANEGQAKQFTEKADLYLDAHLTNGAGSALDSLVAGWSNYYRVNGYHATNPAPMDYKAVNQGELKYIANLMYTNLAHDGYMTTTYPSWTQTNASDYKAANIGELKQIFAFEVAAPQTPINLTVVFGSTTATLTWSDPVFSIQGFTIQDSTNGGSTWSTLATVPGNVYSTTVTGLTLGANYSFRITASNGTGASAPSSADAPPILTLAQPTGATLVP